MKRAIITFIGFFVFAVLMQAKVSLNHPTVEGRTEPLGLDCKAPRLGWQIESDKNGVWQKSYRIVVSSSLEKASQHKGDVWDSGRVKSSQSQWVQLPGLQLLPNHNYFWTVFDGLWYQ